MRVFPVQNVFTETELRQFVEVTEESSNKNDACSPAAGGGSRTAPAFCEQKCRLCYTSSECRLASPPFSVSCCCCRLLVTDLLWSTTSAIVTFNPNEAAQQTGNSIFVHVVRKQQNKNTSLQRLGMKLNTTARNQQSPPDPPC